MEKVRAVCYFGIYKSSYTRTRNFIDGLRAHQVKVLECNSRDGGLKKYFILAKKYWKLRKEFSVILVGFPGQAAMPLAWALGKLTHKKIVFDAFVSLYDSMVFDRKKYSPRSMRAYKYWLMDWLSCVFADIILLDTNAHIQYFIETFRIKKEKFRRILVGCDDSVLQPIDTIHNSPEFFVHFHGTYIPTQGIEYIIEAAKLLEKENIQFNIIGRLRTYTEAIELSRKLKTRNIHFIDFVPYEKLKEYLASADVCLGMFGNTDKAKRTGAFKIVEAMAMKKPFITADTPAMREFLTDRVHCLFCRIADSKDLAEKILLLKNDEKLRNQIAENGFLLFKEKLTTEAIGKELVNIIFLDNI